MIRRLLLLNFALAAAACTATVGGAAGQATAVPGSFEYIIASVLDNGNVPNFPMKDVGEDRGRPHGQQTAAALLANTVQPAGARSVYIMIWGAGALPLGELMSATQQTRPRMGRQPVAITEVRPTDVPQFDPAYQPEGTPRAFRITFTGGALGLRFPRALLPQLDIMVCPEGTTSYPDRVTRLENGEPAKGALWMVRDENARMTSNPGNTYATIRPLVWAAR